MLNFNTPRTGCGPSDLMFTVVEYALKTRPVYAWTFIKGTFKFLKHSNVDYRVVRCGKSQVCIIYNTVNELKPEKTVAEF